MKKLGVLGIILSIAAYTIINSYGPIDINIENAPKKTLTNTVIIPTVNGQVVISKDREKGCNETIDVYQSKMSYKSIKVKTYCNWSNILLSDTLEKNKINLDGYEGLVPGNGLFVYNKKDSDHYFLVDRSEYTAYSLQDMNLIINVFSSTRNDNFDLFGPNEYREIENYQLDFSDYDLSGTLPYLLQTDDDNMKTIFTLTKDEVWRQVDKTTWQVYDLNNIKFSAKYTISIQLYLTVLITSILILIAGFFFSFDSLFKEKEKPQIDDIDGQDILTKFKYFLSNNDKILQLKNKQKFLQQQKEFLGFNLIYLKEFKATYIDKVRGQVSNNLGGWGDILMIPHSYVFGLVILGLLFQGLSYLIFGQVSINMTQYNDFIIKYWSDICLWTLILAIFGYSYFKHLSIVNKNINQLVELNTQDTIKDSDLSLLLETFTTEYKESDEKLSFKDGLIRTGLFLFGQPFILGHGSIFGGFSIPTLLILDLVIFMIIFNFLQPIVRLLLKLEINFIYYLSIFKSKKLRTTIKLDKLLDRLLIELEQIKQDVTRSREGEVVKVYRGVKESIKLLDQVFNLLKTTNIQEFQTVQFKSLLESLLVHISGEMLNILTNIKSNILWVGNKYSVDIELNELSQQIEQVQKYQTKVKTLI